MSSAHPGAAAEAAGPAPLGTMAGDLAGTALALSRRFAAGATLWCVAPAWPSHADHVAVEFVHPVVVGKRALPAVAVHDADLVASLRLLTRPGDVVLAVAPGDDADVATVMRRAEPWGVRTVWIGTGPRPAPGAADHVLWLDDAGPAGPHAGGFVLVYHLLWELTHVCFEHPGLLQEDAACEAEEGHCVTCGDEGRLGEVVAVLDGDRSAARTADGREVIDTGLVGPVREGDLVLIHAGAAIALVEADR